MAAAPKIKMDADMSLFAEVYASLRGLSLEDEEVGPEQGSCPCDDTVEEHGVLICRMCGSEVKEEVEGRWTGIEGGKGVNDPTRCHARKVDEKSIFKDVEGLGICSSIIHVANEIYLQATRNSIYRGESRRGIIFSCLFHAFKLCGSPQTVESLQVIYPLDRRVMLKGMKHVSLHAPKDSAFRTTYITPVEIIDEVMTKLNATKDHKAEVVSIYEKVKNRSSVVNRSKPQSVAAGLVYYYITKQNKRIAMKDFTKVVALSEMTITKLVKEIERIIDGAADKSGADASPPPSP